MLHFWLNSARQDTHARLHGLSDTEQFVSRIYQWSILFFWWEIWQSTIAFSAYLLCALITCMNLLVRNANSLRNYFNFLCIVYMFWSFYKTCVGSSILLYLNVHLKKFSFLLLNINVVRCLCHYHSITLSMTYRAIIKIIKVSKVCGLLYMMWLVMPWCFIMSSIFGSREEHIRIETRHKTIFWAR